MKVGYYTKSIHQLAVVSERGLAMVRKTPMRRSHIRQCPFLTHFTRLNLARRRICSTVQVLMFLKWLGNISGRWYCNFLWKKLHNMSFGRCTTTDLLLQARRLECSQPTNNLIQLFFPTLFLLSHSMQVIKSNGDSEWQYLAHVLQESL